MNRSLIAAAAMLLLTTPSLAQTFNANPYFPTTGGRCESVGGPRGVCYRGGSMRYGDELTSGDDELSGERGLALTLLRAGLPNDCRLYQGNMPPTRSHALAAKYRECRARR